MAEDYRRCPQWCPDGPGGSGTQPVQRAVERDEIPYPNKVHDTTLRPLLNITITSTIVARSRSRSCGGGDICGTTPAGQLPHKDRM